MKKRFYPLVMSVIFTLTSYAQFFDSKNEQEVLNLMQFIDRGVEHFDTIPYMRRDSCTYLAGGNYMEYRYARDRLDQLGYSEFTDDEYIQWVKEATELVEKENALKNREK